MNATALRTVRNGERCPGCHVVCTPDSEHLDSCGYIGRLELVPAFRKPWEHGAKAYPEADSLAALRDGCKRRRVPFTAIIWHSTHALDGEPCAACGGDLAEPSPHSDTRDSYAFADVDPRTKTVVLRHYYCAWTSTLAAVSKLRRVLEGA